MFLTFIVAPVCDLWTVLCELFRLSRRPTLNCNGQDLSSDSDDTARVTVKVGRFSYQGRFRKISLLLPLRGFFSRSFLFLLFLPQI